LFENPDRAPAEGRQIHIRNAAINGSLLIFSIILTVGVIELILRIGASLDPPPTGHHDLCCEYHPVLGWRHTPNASFELVRSEYQITERFNSRGVRGPEYSLDKPPGEYRIVIIGDSFAEGITVNFDMLFSEVMKRRLNMAGEQRFEVINLGVAGYSTDQQLLLYRTEGKRYHPDLTILMVYDNDIWFNAQMYYTMAGRGSKPLFQLVNGELNLTTTPVPRESVEEASANRDSSSRLGRIKSALNEYSHVYRWVRTRVRNTASLQSLFVSLGIMDANSRTSIPLQYGIYKRAYSPETQYAWTMTKALIAELKKEVESADSKFVVFHAPFNATIRTEYWTRFKQNYGVTDIEWSASRVNEELESVLEQLDIEFLNPVESLRRSAVRERVHFERDPHWNENGNRVVGELMAEYVRTAINPFSAETNVE